MGADGSFEGRTPGSATPACGFDLRRIDSHPDHWYPLAWVPTS